MYMREARKEVPVTPIPFGLGVALAVSIAGYSLSRNAAEPSSAVRAAVGSGPAFATARPSRQMLRKLRQ